ncbi:TonB-dependent receptor [Terrimonas alba]|uniref:TonB-dependent receptor n=1 Tax=Terrimonas alba TaxID=3349636 RepID=UPI0035F46322
MKKIILLFSFVLLLSKLFAQQTKISGTVTDQSTNEPVANASVTVKGKLAGTNTDAKGIFMINLNQKLPLTLVVSIIGYDQKEIVVTNAADQIAVQLQKYTGVMNEVVVSASRVRENILQSPVSIEKMNYKTIRETPSLNFYEALRNIKSVEMVTSSLTYSQINTRGFNHTGNARFLQVIDGMDNQTPGLNFSVGNMLGASELDMESVELIPGAASALYGPIAFNGVLMMTTKDPFKYQGLSSQIKFGVNHIGEQLADPHLVSDLAIRYAKAFNNRFAFKLNASYLAGLDWYATNYTDVDAQTPVANRGDNNPGRNALNIYGDEVARTITGVGRVSRTGYEERFLMDYDVYSLKLSGSLHYRIADNLEAIYEYKFGQGTAAYTGSNRFSINNFTLQNHRFELKGSNYFVRAYTAEENSHDSYNARSLGQLINRTWVRDLNGNIVSAQQADNIWFNRYNEAYQGNIGGVAGGNHSAARAFADEGRFLPGSAEYNQQKDRLIHVRGMGGAGIFSNSKFFHTEGQYDLTGAVKVIDVLVGGNFRKYNMFTDGTLFDDKSQKITIKEYGVFTQVSKKLLNEQLKLTASIRYDKNENFDGNFTPRFSAVYTVAKVHNFRASFQTGFRNPTPVDQYIKLNAGPITILGGAPNNSKGMNVYENSVTAASMGIFGPAFGQAVAGGASPQDAIMQHKDKLVKSNVAYIKPEQLKTFEVGYKALLNNRVLIDVNFYFSSYTDFIINQVVMKPNSPVLGSDGKINPDAAADLLNGNMTLYQLYTNAADKVSSQGATAGVTYMFNKGYTLGANATWASFDIKDANPNNVPAFNTPDWRTTVTVGNSSVTKRMGFNLAWRWQNAYDWVGSFNELRPGRINAFSTIDAAVSYMFPAIKTGAKLGASNLFNHKVYQAFGSPSVGAVYYVSLTFDQLLK